MKEARKKAPYGLGGRTFQKEGPATANALSVHSDLSSTKGISMAGVEGARGECTKRRQRGKGRGLQTLQHGWGLYSRCQGSTCLAGERTSLSDFEHRLIRSVFLKTRPLWLLLG